MPRSRKRRNPKTPTEVASHNEDLTASTAEPEIQSTRTSSQAEITTETEVSHSRDTVALQEQSADKRVSKDVEESEPRVEREDPNITAVCQDYTTRCNQQPQEVAATGETRILGAKVDVHAWREKEGGYVFKHLYRQGTHFDRRHVQPFWENIDQLGFNEEELDTRTCGDFRRMNLIPVRPFNRSKKQFVKGERRWGFGVKNGEEGGQNLDDIYLRITDKPVLGYQFIDEDTLKPIFGYEQYHYAVMAGTGKTGAVPVHLEGMVYERSKSENGKRVFGRVRQWDGMVPVKSNRNDFQETSSDLTNQGNLSDTHKRKVARDVKVAKILKREGIFDYNTIHVVNQKSAVGETKQLELQNQYDKQQRASAAAEKAFAAREARKKAIASGQRSTNHNIGAPVKAKPRKKTRGKKVAAKSNDGQDEDVLDEAVKASFIRNYTEKYEIGSFMSCVACFFCWVIMDNRFTDDLQLFLFNPGDSTLYFREIVRNNYLIGKLENVYLLGQAAMDLGQALEKNKDKFMVELQKLTLDHFIRPFDPIYEQKGKLNKKTPFVMALECAEEAEEILSTPANGIPSFLQEFVDSGLYSANCREWFRIDSMEANLRQLKEKKRFIQRLFEFSVKYIDVFPTDILKHCTTWSYDDLHKLFLNFTKLGVNASNLAKNIQANILDPFYSDYLRKWQREDAPDVETGTDL